MDLPSEGNEKRRESSDGGRDYWNWWGSPAWQYGNLVQWKFLGIHEVDFGEDS